MITKRERECFTVTSYYFVFQLLHLKLEMKFLAIRSCELDDKIPDPIQRPNLSVELILSTIGPLNLGLIV